MTFEDANWNVFIEKKGLHNRINEKCDDNPLHSLSPSQGTFYQLEHPPSWVVAVKDHSFPSFCYLYSRLDFSEIRKCATYGICTGSPIFVVGQCSGSRTPVSKSG